MGARRSFLAAVFDVGFIGFRVLVEFPRHAVRVVFGRQSRPVWAWYGIFPIWAYAVYNLVRAIFQPHNSWFDTFVAATAPLLFLGIVAGYWLVFVNWSATKSGWLSWRPWEGR